MDNHKRKSYKQFFIYTLLAIAILLIMPLIVGVYHFSKSNPSGTNIEGKIYNLSDSEIQFLSDLTYTLSNGSKVYEQSIFSNIFSLIDNAQEFIVIDMFLFNSNYDKKEGSKNITQELKSRLISKKLANQNISISFTTDPINTLYGTYNVSELEELSSAGINVVYTDLTKMRDSNPGVSMFWRTYFQWFDNSKFRFLANPVGGKERVSLASILTLLNTKANHRKLIVADSPEGISSIVSSANPHEASSTHSNIAFLVKSKVWQDILPAERAVAEFSGRSIPEFQKEIKPSTISTNQTDIQVQFLTDGKIRDSLIKDLNNANPGESIDIAMFYLSDRGVVDSLILASNRGVNIRLILDANKDAFAREKNGIPNRPIANELVKKSNGKIQVKWYSTSGEQFHTKLVIIRKSTGQIIVYGGSANLTRRNINYFNLEADLKILSPANTYFEQNLTSYYSRLWENKDANFTLEFSAYQDNSQFKYWLYRFQEFSGMSSF